MATSRTATTEWKKLRARMKRKAVVAGRFRCAACGIPLSPNGPPHAPTSPELHHRVSPVDRPDLALDPTNLEWRCHPCNRREGRPGFDRIPTTRAW